MSRNGSGTYTIPVNSWNPATNGVAATAADWQAIANDLASALTQSISTDGQTPIAGNLNMGSNKLINLALGNAPGQSLAWQQLFSQGNEADLASAATTDIGAQNTNFLRITGTTTITSFGTNFNGPKFLRFAGVLTLTHNATTLILPGGADIATSAGMVLIATPISGGWLISASNSSAAMSFLQSGTGAVPRTMEAKARESLSAADRGAVGDGTTDDTAAIQSALDNVLPSSSGFDIQLSMRGGTVRLGPGRYRITATLNMKAGTRLIGAGPNTSVLVNETGSGDVLRVLGVDTGSVDPVEIEELAVVQKLGVPHTSGYAINIDGNGFGTSPRLRNVMTQDTYGGVNLDWCFPGTLNNVQAFRHAIEGFRTKFNCTSLTFLNCYAGANGGSGFKIAGNYISMVGCASDSNTLDGYELYYDGGASTALSLISCGAEANLRDGISEDRVGSLSIVAPRMITAAAGLSCVKLDGGDAIAITSPVLSGAAVNANPCINIVSTSGALPSNVQLTGFSGTTTNYATLTNQPDVLFWIGSRANMGAYGNTLRLGGVGSFNRDLQVFQIGSNYPLGSGSTAYAANYVPVATVAYSLVSSARYKPVINAPALVVARSVSGPLVEAATVTSGTVTRHEGIRVNDQAAGVSADAGVVLGDSAVPVGRWSICNTSTRTSLFAGSIQWSSSTGPQERFGAGTPEGVVTAAVGSTYRRTDGGAGTSFYVKESGTGNTGWVGK